MTEERAAAVLRVLETELPPSTVDINRALRVGRRRERTRRGLAAGALAGVTVLAGIGVVTVTGDGAAPPPTERFAASRSPGGRACVAARLPGQGETYAVSPNGRFVAGATADPAVPLLWTDGPPTPATLPAGTTATPHAVNDDGVMVGLARSDDRTVPFALRGGTFTVLPLPTGASEGVANAVNARGDIAGTAYWPDGSGKAVRWPASGGVTVLASTTRWAAANAIADDGTAFGTLDDGATPYLWGPDGAGRRLPAIAGSQRGKAFGVAGDYVYGHAGTPEPTGGTGRTDKKARESGTPRWVRWQLSTGTVVEVTGLEASDVDATGAVVGSIRKGEGFAPARWRDGQIVELPGADGGPGTLTVVGTSGDGTRLVGGATNPVEWRC